MSTISLHKYHDQINLLLEDNQFSLAASHCRYILQQYPRHVDTYRLLAKTLIEQGDFSGATQLFQRVLCADPNDYIAHAGLSVVYREGDVLSQALWHLERAFEIEPYNSAIQQELRVLYIEFSEQKLKQKRGDAKGNEIPDSLPLTQGALARLYIQGELYVQAIDVLRGALAEDGDRIDLEVLLAEALWRDHQRMAAVQICLQVLEKLPNCITANAILAEIWLQTGRTDEAKQYLENLQALTLMDVACQDLDSPEGSAFQPEGAIALPAVFELNRMGDDDMASLMDLAVGGSGSEDGVVALEEGDAYQWLNGLGDDLEVDDTDISTRLPLTTTDSDWLRRELGASDGETAVSDDLSDWLADLAEPNDEDESGIDTFGVLAAGAVAAGVIGKQLADDEADSDEFAALAGSGEEDSFDWFSEGSVADAVPEENATVFAQMERAEEAEEMPDWLADMSGDALEPVQVNPLDISGYLRNGEGTDYLSGSDDAEEDIYDWLNNKDADDDETADELNAGDLDLSQFAEFGKEKVDVEDDEEIVWRLTDELNPLAEESVETEEAENVGKFDLEILPDETGELGDIPDWLVGSRGMDELDAASLGESAGNEVADELAEWVAANQPDALENDDLSDWLSDEPEVAEASEAPDADLEEEDDFFSSELPSWMVDSPTGLVDSAPLISEPLPVEEITAEADLPDWLMGGSLGVDDSGLLDTGTFSNETGGLGAVAAVSEPDDDLPDWLTDDVVDGETQASDDEGLLDWLSGEDEDDHAGTAVVGGLLGAMAAGVIAKELLDDDDEDEDHPEQLVIDSGLEHEVMEDAVSDRQDDLLGPQDEPEKIDAKAKKESDQFDWLDDLDGPSLSAKEDTLPITDLDDGLDWMNLDEDGETDDLNLDALLGLEIEEDIVEEKASEEKMEPVVVGLADDESLDWLDALSGDAPEAIDEMPTWQWPEDEAAPDLVDVALALPALDTEVDAEKPVVEEWGDLFSDEPAEEDVVEDLDDAMAWLENLAAEPDAPVEELPSVAENMDLDSLFAAESDLDNFDFLSGESVQTETLDEIFAVDTQNDSWLEGLTDGKDPLPDFLEDDSEFDFEGLVAETAVIPENNQPLETVDDVGEPPEDLDDAMAWLEQLAARQGAPLDELPSVEKHPTEQDGLGAGEMVAGAAALGALGALFAGEDDDEIEPVHEPAAEAAEFAGVGDEFMAEEDLLAMEVPEDPDEAMAWLERLAARQGAPLDELPSVSEYEEIPAAFVVATEDDDADWFSLDSDEPVLDGLLAKPDAAPGLTEAEEDSFGVLDDTMAWLEGLNADEDVTETAVETAISESDELEAASEFGELIDFDFDDEELDLFEFEDEPEPVVAEMPASLKTDYLSDDLDWLESVTDSGEAVSAYNAADVSVSDDELADALEKLTRFTALGVVAGVVVADKNETEVEEVVGETAVSAPETTLYMSADDFIDEMPDDPDEAMAWLEKLAARQGAPLDELPSVAKDEYDGLAAAGIAAAAAEAAAFEAELEVEPAPEVILEETPAAVAAVAAVDPGDMDMDDAMAWLEQLAARQGTSLDELPTVDASDLEKDVAAPDWITTAQEQAQEEALAVEESIIEAVVEIEEEDLTADAEVALPEDMDMDDAMAWLERLAARQGTPLNELPTVDAVPEADSDMDAPDWIAQQTGPLNESVIDSLNLPDVSDDVFDVDTDDDFFAALDEVPAIEGIEAGARSSSAPDMEDIDDSMPDWLSGGVETGAGSPLGHTGWLNTLDEPDMDGWLAAEAEATVSSDMSASDMPKAVDTDSLLSTGGLEDTGSLYESKRKSDTGQLHFPGSTPRGSMFTSELDETQIFADLDIGDLGGGLDQARLASARNGLAGGDIEAALVDYQNLVEAGESMHTVISDLERASELHRDKPMVRRMLGDAYMRNGQINKAIETYREALDQM